MDRRKFIKTIGIVLNSLILENCTYIPKTSMKDNKIYDKGVPKNVSQFYNMLVDLGLEKTSNGNYMSRGIRAIDKKQRFYEGSVIIFGESNRQCLMISFGESSNEFNEDKKILTLYDGYKDSLDGIVDYATKHTEEEGFQIVVPVPIREEYHKLYNVAIDFVLKESKNIKDFNSLDYRVKIV